MGKQMEYLPLSKFKPPLVQGEQVLYKEESRLVYTIQNENGSLFATRGTSRQSVERSVMHVWKRLHPPIFQVNLDNFM